MPEETESKKITALKAAQTLEKKSDMSGGGFRKGLDFIGGAEFEKLHGIIDDYMDAIFENGVNMKTPREKDLVHYTKNYFGAAFGFGGVPKEITDKYNFINDYAVLPKELRDIIDRHINQEDGKSAYESADVFAKLVMDMGDAKSSEDIEKLAQKAISMPPEEKQKSSPYGLMNKERREEEIMPDQSEKEGIGKTGESGAAKNFKDLTPEQLTAEDRYVKEVLWQRKTVMAALAAGKLACLPNERGYADTRPAVNLINNTTYNGVTLLYLKEVQRQRGFPTAEFVTMEQIEKAEQTQGKRIYIEKGEKGITTPYKEQDKTTGEWTPKQQTLFNAAQLSNPEEIRSYAKAVQQEKERSGREWAAQNGKTLRSPWHESEITCTSSEPKEYLGQYLAAVTFGARFKASRVQAAEFTDKMEKQIFEPTQTGKPNPMNILKLSSQANAYAKEYRNQVIEDRVSSAREKQQQQQQPEQNRESRKREETGMGW